MNDKEMTIDALTSQKYIDGNYNVYANECANPQLRNEFINILKEEHDIQYDLYTEAQKRGWYAAATADTQKITQARQKFTQQ